MDLNLRIKGVRYGTVFWHGLWKDAGKGFVIRFLSGARSPEEFEVCQDDCEPVDGKTWLDKNLKKPYDILEVHDEDIDNLKKDNLIIKATNVSEFGTANSFGLDHYLQSGNDCIVIRVIKTGKLIPASDWNKDDMMDDGEASNDKKRLFNK